MHQTPKPEPARPGYPVEIGAPSPVTPRKDSHAHPAGSDHVPPPIAQPVEERLPSAGQYHSDVSVRSDSLNSTGNIDSVIQAWTTPLKPRPVQQSTSQPESRASAPQVSSPEPGPSPSSVKVNDPYADLEPEFKASLKRYAAMLRKEAAAETDDDKFTIFQTFVTKELRLRSLIYGVELKKEAAKEVRKAASLADIQAMLPSSALPTGAQSEYVGRVKEPVRKASEPAGASVSAQLPQMQPPASTPLPGLAQPVAGQKERPKPETVKSASFVPPLAPQWAARPPVEDRAKSKDDGYVMVAAPGADEAYSPGGRPLMTKVSASGNEETYSPGGRPMTTKPTIASPAKPSIRTSDQGPLRQPSQEAWSPSNDAPMVMDDYVTLRPASPSINAPIVVAPEPPPAQSSPRPSQGTNKPVIPIKFEPARPAYTPFRYNAGVQEEKAKTLAPADKAYSSLRSSQVDSGRLLAQDAALLAPVRPTSTSGRKEHDEAFIGLIRKQSMAVRHKSPGRAPSLPGSMKPGIGGYNSTPAKSEPPLVMRVGTPAGPLKPQQPPADHLKEAVDALQALLPPSDNLQTPIDSTADHPKLKTVKSKIDSIPDQFSFVHDAVVEWDRTNRMVRKEQEAERQHRQGESEAHIDALFNDNEIGYADIGELEAEFKLSEAEKRYDEDQAELESFTSQVFVVVTERLQKEIAELMTAYTVAVDLLDLESLAVTRCFKAHDGEKKQVRMTEVMSCVLMLFNKIDTRHRKLAEAHVERERRRKHLELTVLYTNGDVQAVKELEKEFAAAEKMAVLHEARAKDNRANKLMDSFDRATVRGLGDNQVFTDEVFAKLQDLNNALDITSSDVEDKISEANGLRETLHLAQNTLDSITSDSRRLLALSNEADVLLNDADFNVSVAEARVANADKPTYAKLEQEKGKEDMKLIEEMNKRMGSVAKGPAEAGRLLREISERIGDGSAMGDGAGEGKGEDPEHAERIKRALEMAKMRNEAAAGGSGGIG